jgi:hypothetical protein
MNATNAIGRIMRLQEFVVDTELPEEFVFDGVVPFNLNIKGNQVSAEILAETFDEAAALLHNFLHPHG